MTRMNLSVIFTICLMVVFIFPSTNGLEISESQMWEAIYGLAPYHDMLRGCGDNITEQVIITAAAMEKVQEKVVSQNLTRMYDQFRLRRQTSLFTFRSAACIACGYSLGFLVAACVDCIHPPE
ncbi:hypothetical protein Mapa_002520 [Marchantia paleacea]|nr:hypothetical protein Mapa_002520 [Marchantia paleacea]